MSQIGEMALALTFLALLGPAEAGCPELADSLNKDSHTHAPEVETVCREEISRAAGAVAGALRGLGRVEEYEAWLSRFGDETGAGLIRDSQAFEVGATLEACAGLAGPTQDTEADLRACRRRVADLAKYAAKAIYYQEDCSRLEEWHHSVLLGTHQEANGWYLLGLAANVYEHCYPNQNLNELKAERFLRAAERSLPLDRPDFTARCYGLVGRARRHQHAYQDAIHALNLAWEYAVLADTKQHQYDMLDALFATFGDLGDLAGARWVLDREREILRSDDPEHVARLVRHEATVFSATGQPSRAYEAFSRVIELSPEADPREFARNYLNLAACSLALGRPEEAETHLGLIEAAHPDLELPYASYLRARVFAARGEHDTAAVLLRRALAGWTGGADATEHKDWLWQFEFRLGESLLALGDRQGALRALERSAAIVDDYMQNLRVDSLKEIGREVRRGPYEALFSLHAAAGHAVEALAVSERMKARAILDAIESDGPATLEARDDVPRRLQRRIGLLQALVPVAHESGSARARPAASILRELAGHAFINYVRAGDRMWLVALHDDALHLRDLGDVREIRGAVARFKANVDDPRAAAELGRLLLPDPELLPSAQTTLHIIPDDTLDTIPFAALRIRGRFLVERYPILHAPSLSVLTADRSPPAAWGPPVVIGNSRDDLEGAEDEATAVASLLKTHAILNDAGTTDRLHAARNASRLHLSVHSGLERSFGWLGMADGRIYADEIVSMGIGPRLAVLASCVSGRNSAPGLWGALSVAFLAAGSERVVGTLWSVDDQLARKFVLDLYREDRGRDPIHPVARVQREWISRGVPPRRWAGYVVIGSTTEWR